MAAKPFYSIDRAFLICLCGGVPAIKRTMEVKNTPFEQLTITNKFMFAMVFSHKEIAKPFLEAILGLKIHELREPEPEKTIDVSPVSKGVRFDVFVKETGPNGEALRSFDIEMQMENTHEIPKRARFYQAMRDSEALCKGEKYRDLKELYIIFLCHDDIFGKGRAVYRFKNLETDDSKIEMGDHTFKNFFIFSKYRKVAEKAIRDYMEYFATNKANTPATEDIDRLVKWYQTDSNTRIRYMTWQEEIDDMRALADEEKARADKAELLASEEKNRADKAEARVNELEKKLREHGLL